MVKVLSHGNMHNVVKTFYCSECNCIFEADAEHFEAEDDGVYSCKCPECGKVVYAYL